ncbi:Tyrosine recombinase XerD [Frondihabitans sp. 762G35]|uniref:tyrosine-type recombinase/integrase n=1 Tax=Frondihabitans sp. 762G35 TaxID=1446794 RepID=UPI000D2286E7|nr:tyrosine-type recombinase/integrase [Frondihabitans sp. 762G35]ARC56038.1 Tyrosine recombinase XerD [Frondihabitans sp. 762G35]
MAKKKPGRKRGNGDGGLYWIESRQLWRAVVDNGYWPDGRRRQLSVMGKTAEIARAKMKTKLDEIDEFGAPIDAKTTLAEWAPHWLETVCKPHLKPNALAKYESLSRTWIVPLLGKRSVASLKPSDVRLLHKHIIDSGRSSSTALATHNVLSGMLKAARLDGIAKRNVADDVEPPKAAVSDRGSLSPEDAINVLKTAAKQDDGTRWWVALLGGLRQSERTGARIESLDLDKGILAVEWQLDEIPSEHGCGERVEGVWPCRKKQGAACSHRRLKIPNGFEYKQLAGRLCLIRPKSGKTRDVPLLPQVVVELRKHLARTADEPNPHGLIWHNPDGSPILPGEDQQAWTALLLAAGVIAESDIGARPIPTTHWARHTTATVLMELGVDAKIIGEIVGHQSEAVTRRYQHVSSAAARDAIGQLGAHFADALEVN